MRSFKFWNNLTGWIVFAIAATTYLLTMEPSSSLWDCGEFIATSYKLEVGHPPGAPLFMILARIATIFAPSTHYVPHMVNGLNCIVSAFTILFLFWTITHIARRLFSAEGREFTKNSQWAALGAGVVGALAYTFTDTFWFSAVEGEVYAMSSMFTALVVWLMLRWEDEADEPHSHRWIILIAYLMGLSIGIHILNLLAIPALVFIYYFRKSDKVTLKGVFISMLISGAILLFINGFVISQAIYLGAMVDLFFVNTLGLPVNSGMVVYSLALIGGLGYASYLTHRKGKLLLNMIFLSLTMLFVGYSSYASVTIRASVNPPMNSNNPNNPHALLSLLNRDQYGSRPLLYGAYYSAPVEDYTTRQFYYLDEEGKYSKGEILSGYTHPSEFMHLFPRIWNYNKGDEYKAWAAYRTSSKVARNENGEQILDASGRPIFTTSLDFGKPKVYMGETYMEPTFGENLNYFFNYQFNYMFWRYFLWNFVGRQNDIQASTVTISDGNWLSGINFIDEAYLGPQRDLPGEIESNRARNTYYFLPFILGLIGLIYQLNRDPKNFSIVMWLFVMMGIALVVYFNSSPSEPRERDYVYAGAFYAFTIWIGLGLLALRDLIAWISKRDSKGVVVVAFILSMSVPTILATENWDDHDRSGRTMARDIGWNYLQSTLPNSIIMNYGDNDTFPLWFNQEVDGVRTDVRIMNTSYLGGEWYIDQMKLRSNESDPVPFTLPRSKYAYVNDWLPVYSQVESASAKQVVDFIRNDEDRSKMPLADGSMTDYIPTKRIAIPVNKENALASGIVKEKDAHLMVDTVYINITKGNIDKIEMMLIDLFANFDWKRPLYFTQVYILQNLGLVDYLQFDGYAYRFVPIYTPYTTSWDVGRIDPDYAAPLLLETFRYGNLSDESVYVDNFFQYNLNAAKTREGFARVANAYIREGKDSLARELLDKGLEVLPVTQIRYTPANTIPFVEGYYDLGDLKTGDALFTAYINNIVEHIEYYLLFEGYQGDLVSPLIDARLDELAQAYQLAAYSQRVDILAWLNDYYRSLGATDEDLYFIESDPELDSLITPTQYSYE
ncbi:MAG: DUF2723 domain-containing protein [Rikenellaceae bacterium]